MAYSKPLLILMVAAAILTCGTAAPAPAAPAAETAGDVPAPAAAGTPVPKVTGAGSEPAPAGTPVPKVTGTTAAAEPAAAGGTPVPKVGAAPAAKGAAAPALDAETTAAMADIDVSSIPKVASGGEVISAGGSTAVGQNNTKGATAAAGEEFPLDGFNPTYPPGKEANENQVVVEVVTDSPIDTIKTNQVPFIQSLADALGVSTTQIYWYKLIKSDLNIAKFLVDSDSPDAKKKVLGNLANPDNTARFYDNAAAYTLNILNGPQVAPDQLQLGEDVISTPDNYKAYDGDTGLISNNATGAPAAGAAKSAAQAVQHGVALTLMTTVLALLVAAFSLV